MADRIVTISAEGQTDLSVATCHLPSAVPIDGTPLLVALHGGTYNREYFAVAGGSHGSFLDIAARNGFDVLTVDRPGYGKSTLLEDDRNDFATQAGILDAVIADRVAELGVAAIVLVGHSIGGMVALELAARQPDWPLVGVSVTGMGARIPSGGAAEQLGSLPLEGVIDLPVSEREGVMFGPAGSFSEAARVGAQASYSPVPFIELKRAPVWARERLAKVALEVTVPVQNILAEYDALWDSSPGALAEFESCFAGGAGATSHLALGVGHSIDHHLLGAVTHLEQLAFAYRCAPTS